MYRNNSALREKIFEFLEKLAAQMDLSQAFIRTPLFGTYPNWPTDAELQKIPLQGQCELLEYTGSTFIIVRSLVIDVNVEDEIPMHIKRRKYHG